MLDKSVKMPENVKMLEIKYIGDYEPKFATDGSAAFDLQAVEKLRIYPGELGKVSLGISFEVPEGYYLEVVPRSSLAKEGVILANSIGIIDNDYRGEVFAILRNVSKKKIIINKGDRIVQAMLKPVIKNTFKKVNNLSVTARGTGGYGSTGK